MTDPAALSFADPAPVTPPPSTRRSVFVAVIRDGKREVVDCGYVEPLSYDGRICAVLDIGRITKPGGVPRRYAAAGISDTPEAAVRAALRLAADDLAALAQAASDACEVAGA